MVSEQARSAAQGLAAQALVRVQDGSGRVRVEDYLVTLAALTGEAALVASGVIDIETTDLTPGAGIFGDPINQTLSGDSTDLAQVPTDTVVGILVAELVPDTVSLAQFGALERLYRHFAENIGSAEWGMVATTVPADHKPTVLPIRAAFELRPAVDSALAASGLPANQRHVLCALALATALEQVKGAIAIGIGLTLALEVAFGTAKMVPMSRRAFAAVAAEQGATGSQPAG